MDILGTFRGDHRRAMLGKLHVQGKCDGACCSGGGEFKDSSASRPAVLEASPEQFDGLRYIASNPDLIRAFGADAEAGQRHYIEFGQAEGRRIDSFSPFQYGASHPDLIGAFGRDANAYTSHYIRLGFGEGRSTTGFDPLNYAAANPDLFAAFGRNGDALASHYIEHGFRERRPTDFDGLSYAAANPDLARAFGANEPALLSHYLDHGAAEGRRTSGFDALRYGASNPDLARAYGTDVAGLTSHYVAFGVREGRSVDGFDALLYGASNTDLARAFGPDARGLTLHYLQNGVFEGRVTTGFDGVAYILSNQDLASAGIGIGGALNHWLNLGADEGRGPSGQFGLDQTNHALGSNGQVSDTHAINGDRDWFQVSLAANQLVTVRLSGGTLQDPFLRIYDGSGRLLLSGNNAGVGVSETLTFRAPSGGTFYLVTGSAGDSGAGTYTLALSSNAVPILTSGSTTSVQENTSVNTVVYQATATDADGEPLVFSIGGTHAGSFTIDAATGAVRLRTPADFEVQQSYRFTVTATDPQGQSASREVTLAVTDVAETPTGSTPQIAEVESNDTLGSAQRLDRGGFAGSSNANLSNAALPSVAINGSLAVTTDRDFFSVFLNAGERLILDVDNTTGGLDSLLRIYGTNGVEIGDGDGFDDSALDPGSAPAPYSNSMTLDSGISFRAPAAGTYTFSVEAWLDPQTGQRSTGGYSLNVSVGPPGTAAEIQEEDIQALISGARWNSATLTFGFPQSPSEYPAGTTGEGELTRNFEGFNAVQQNAVRATLNEVAYISNLNFSENFSSPGTANLRYAMSDEANPAYALLPTGSPRSGTSFYRNTGGTFDNPIRGGYAYMTILHETGHALGLKHGHELPALSPGHDSIQFSVMTYRGYIGDPLDDGGYRNETFGFAQSFMMYDIAALQRMYGADFTANGGDTTYSWNPNSGQMIINGVGQAVPGANRILLTVWDGGGNDTYNLSNYANGTIIDLRPGEFSTTSQVQLANLGLNNYAIGNVANALLFNGDTRSLIENAIGGGGGDVLIANQAVNGLTGGAGGDTFRWVSAADSRPGAVDTVFDFQTGIDRLDLSRIDADTGTAGDDAFRFIGTNAFSGSPGELRYESDGRTTRILGNVNGDRIADFDLLLANVAAPVASDFFF